MPTPKKKTTRKKRRLPRTPEEQARRDWALAVRRRDKACRACGHKTGLHAHHVIPIGVFPQFRLRLDNGLTLCRFHHTELHRAQLDLLLLPQMLNAVDMGADLDKFFCLQPRFGVLALMPRRPLPSHELLRVVPKNPKKRLAELHPEWAATHLPG